LNEKSCHEEHVYSICIVAAIMLRRPETVAARVEPTILRVTAI